MDYFHEGSAGTVIDLQRAGQMLDGMLEQLGPLRRVLLVPPDFTRFHSWAGELTVLLYDRLKESSYVETLPATGTHFPMTEVELGTMFPGIPHDCFRVHDWRKDLKRLGKVPGEYISELSSEKLDYPVICEINSLLVEGKWDRIISIGQLVPHEVIGIANHNKNIYVGTGGQDTINKTHYLGAVCNMEKIMGREKSPVRDVLDYADEHFGKDLPIVSVLSQNIHTFGLNDRSQDLLRIL